MYALQRQQRLHFLQVRRAYDGRPTGNAVYDIEYDDGDKEEGVVAGRVRRPGQSVPPLEAGAAVDIKLARKGKVRQLNTDVGGGRGCTYSGG